MLLFQCGESGRMAVELSAVARLEEFSPDALESSGEQDTVQYRGDIMPLIRLSQVLYGGPKSGNENEPLQVVVHMESGRHVGLVVDRILDVVDEPFLLKRQMARRGVLGSAVIQKKITDVVDVPGLLAWISPVDPAIGRAGEEA
jgi:two-component system chemotaxis sensor kinase CheA